MKKRITAIILTLVMALAMLTGCAGSSEPTKGDTPSESTTVDFPKDTITIVVPWGVGGGADVISRKFAQLAEKHLGKPVIVENHTGASGTTGMATAFSREADGYTMVVTNGPLFSLTPRYVSTDYKIEDFTMLKGLRTVSLVFLVNPEKTGINTFEELIEYGKTNKIKYATSSGPGGDQYVCTTAMFKTLGIDAEPVVFGSQSESINAIVTGQVHMAIATPPGYYDFQREGSIKAVATLDPNGVETEFGRVPSVKELGTDVEFLGMDAFAVRSEVPEEIKTILIDTINKVYADEEFKSYMKEIHQSIWEADSDEILDVIKGQFTSFDNYVKVIE
ncbi:tripartite tricarboxylate transporter substrate binding protein [Petroclostridium sp. X23]|uniref:Bug family tripartite tricarboxylate transporter substrate binding protein n=1 Tax=Petroclostridium sp. X23 TaxID=3045146 RepID=UPI0024ADE4A8|nr:tripartite tricarboxylate transporter substrate binding protein [Petroclostridium sp. X23]WHH58580.1 tripartite tricarboxylate transporter substrate binding protein [Petroclostridium sp. X23]